MPHDEQPAGLQLLQEELYEVCPQGLQDDEPQLLEPQLLYDAWPHGLQDEVPQALEPQAEVLQLPVLQGLDDQEVPQLDEPQLDHEVLQGDVCDHEVLQRL